MYRIVYDTKAKKDLKFWQKNSVKTYDKIMDIIEEIAVNPREGSGKPEPLVEIEDGWSRRINRKDRIIYQIYDTYIYVQILSARGHYGDH